jgi:hypothetical protein
LRQYPLKMKAAEAGLLSKTHVNQLHPLPHLRAVIQHKLSGQSCPTNDDRPLLQGPQPPKQA